MHGDSNTTLDGTAHVVAVPGQTLWNVGVDAHGEQEASKVLDVVVLAYDLDDETCDGEESKAHHEDTAGLHAIGQVATGDAHEASHDVWWHRHELGGVVGVSEGLDDGGQEKGE